jgi:hypothetical protein
MTIRRVPRFLTVLILASVSVVAQDGKKAQALAHAAKPKVCSACIRAHEEFLASDAMQGRGSGTHDELVTATYVAAELRAYGIAPAGDDGGYIQAAPLIKRKVTAPPRLEITPTNGSPVTLQYGKDFLLRFSTAPEFSGPLHKVDTDKEANPKLTAGSVVFATGVNPRKIQAATMSVADQAGGIAVIVTGKAEEFGTESKELPNFPNQLKGQSSGMMTINFLEVSPDAAKTISQLDDGANIKFVAAAEEEKGFTWNAIGILKGTDPKLQCQAILLSAHLDHLGIGEPVNGDNIYNGADDDASGTTAVLELARVLGAGPRPKRTVIFALFGSEESGGLGSTYFREHPPVPLKDLVANLEFEMIGRADSKVPADTLWLTGWERSNLGPTLAAHGAKLVGDPHPDQNFFARSDNYVLAKKGVVAQTISSYGLHSDYHHPSDDLAHLDFKHMDAAIGSMLAPVEWLVNSNFAPQWNQGGQP